MGRERSEQANIYQSIGVEPIINCRGTFTIIGGSVERPEVLAAMEAASGYFVQYDELSLAVGQRLAEITGAEWGMVSAGCAAGMKHVTAACVTGGNPEKLIRIPDLSGLDKTQVIVPRYARNAYDHAVRNVGVEMIEVETPEELRAATHARTAMIYLTASGGAAPGQPLSLETIAAWAEPRDIPILVDAAAEDLTIPNVHLQRGATVVAYSGGKALCGPQCAGLLLGRKDVLQSAWQASSPHHGPGRDDKVGKEEIMGMLAAVEAWVTRDHGAEWDAWLARLERIRARAIQVKGVTTRVDEPAGLSNRAPVLKILWEASELGIRAEEVAEDFARNAPRIAVGVGEEAGRDLIHITPSQMQPGDEEVVAARVGTILAEKRCAPPMELPPADADLSGNWDLELQFFSSTSRHQMLLIQEGNWVKGSHRSDFSTQDVVGTVAGRHVTLRSQVSQPGDSILFLFSGEILADRISGSVFLGEYLDARFSATRSATEFVRHHIAVPGGPPLAT